MCCIRDSRGPERAHDEVESFLKVTRGRLRVLVRASFSTLASFGPGSHRNELNVKITFVSPTSFGPKSTVLCFKRC